MANPSPRRLSLVLILAALPVSAGDIIKPVKLAPTIIGGPEIKVDTLKLEGVTGGVLTPGVMNFLHLETARLADVPQISAPRMQATTFKAADVVAVAAVPVGSPAAKAVGVTSLTEQTVAIERALQQDPGGNAAGAQIDQLYFGRNRSRAVPAWGGDASSEKKASRRGDPSQSAVFIINDDGVMINGRAAENYKEVKRFEAEYAGKIDTAESIDKVMFDSYADVYAKLKLFEHVAKNKGISHENTHLDESLIFLDGVQQNGAERIAMNSHRIYYHEAPEGPGKATSEINEGIRRVDAYLDEVAPYLARGGKADQTVGATDRVVLGFDARGYDAIKQHILGRRAEIEKTIGKPVEFVFLHDVNDVPKTKEGIRDGLNALVKKYNGQGLQKIIEGVIYSRYVGLLLELKTLEHYYKAGYKILQSGRELFDADGHYITELDAVVQAPDGRIVVVEAKSARVKLPLDKALKDKVLYKLDTYIKHRADMEKAIGGPMAEVTFSFDVGRNEELKNFLIDSQDMLSKRYGLPVSFIFIDGGPESRAPGQNGGSRDDGPKHGKKKRR